MHVSGYMEALRGRSVIYRGPYQPGRAPCSENRGSLGYIIFQQLVADKPASKTFG